MYTVELIKKQPCPERPLRDIILPRRQALRSGGEFRGQHASQNADPKLAIPCKLAAEINSAKDGGHVIGCDAIVTLINVRDATLVRSARRNEEKASVHRAAGRIRS